MPWPTPSLERDLLKEAREAFHYAILGCLKICCYPIASGWCCHRPIRRHRSGGLYTAIDAGDLYLSDALTSRPRKRPSGLSAPSPLARGIFFGVTQRHEQQSHSPLFNKLPLELREQTYRLALGGSPIHIMRTSSSHLSHVQCTSTDSVHECLRDECFNEWPPLRDPSQQLGKGLLSLLLTCRAM